MNEFIFFPKEKRGGIKTFQGEDQPVWVMVMWSYEVKVHGYCDECSLGPGSGKEGWYLEKET